MQYNAVQCSTVQYRVHLQQGWLGVTRSPQSMHCLPLLQVLRFKLLLEEVEIWLQAWEPVRISVPWSVPGLMTVSGAPHSSCDLVCIWLWSRIRDQTSPRSSQTDGVRPPWSPASDAGGGAPWGRGTQGAEHLSVCVHWSQHQSHHCPGGWEHNCVCLNQRKYTGDK